MKIPLRQLRAITDRLWDHLEASGHDSIELQHDFYWQVPDDSLYDFNNMPAQPVVGQLYDDWSDLQKLLEDDPDILAYHLVPLSALLRYIGEQIMT